MQKLNWLALAFGASYFAIVTVSLGAPPSGGPDENQAVTGPVVPGGEATLGDIDSLIDRAENAVTTTPNQTLAVVREQNFRISTDVRLLSRLESVVLAEAEPELLRVLGRSGFKSLRQLATQIRDAAQKEDGWAQVRQVVDAFDTEDDMEAFHAKAVVLSWLRKEEAANVSPVLRSSLTVLTLANGVRNPDAKAVVERVRAAMKASKVTDSAQVLRPVAQLLMLSPYLPDLTQELKRELLDTAFRVAASNTDKSMLELIELYLVSIVPELHSAQRLNTTLGAAEAFGAGLDFLERHVNDTNCCTTGPGSVLVALENIHTHLVKVHDSCNTNESLRKLDLYSRNLWQLRSRTAVLVAKHPDLAARVQEFAETRFGIAWHDVTKLCAESVANPLQAIISGT